MRRVVKRIFQPHLRVTIEPPTSSPKGARLVFPQIVQRMLSERKNVVAKAKFDELDKDTQDVRISLGS